MLNRLLRGIALLLIAAATTAACSDDDAIDSDEAARRFYLGLDASIEKSLALGFDGFNGASSANITPQVAPGVATGMLTISGQVDQGASSNKGMRLRVGMVDYSDGVIVVIEEDREVEVHLTYTTSVVVEAQPFLQLALRDIPTGVFTGELSGTYQVTGDLAGDVTLALTMAGALQDAGNGDVIRMPGSTTITGTATSGDGVYDVTLTR